MKQVPQAAVEFGLMAVFLSGLPLAVWAVTGSVAALILGLGCAMIALLIPVGLTVVDWVDARQSDYNLQMLDRMKSKSPEPAPAEKVEQASSMVSSTAGIVDLEDLSDEPWIDEHWQHYPAEAPAGENE